MYRTLNLWNKNIWDQTEKIKINLFGLFIYLAHGFDDLKVFAEYLSFRQKQLLFLAQNFTAPKEMHRTA